MSPILGQDTCPRNKVSWGGTALLIWLGHTSHDPEPDYPISPPQICSSTPSHFLLPPPNPHLALDFSNPAGLGWHVPPHPAWDCCGHKQCSRMLHPSPAPLLLRDSPRPPTDAPCSREHFGSPAAGTAGRVTSSCQGCPGGYQLGLGAAPCYSSGSGPGAAWCSGSGCTGASSAPMPKHCCPCGSPAAPAPWMERNDGHPTYAWQGA